MLRRIPLAFAVLLFAAIFAFPIGRSSAPPQLEPVKILAAAFLPRTAAAQARDTLDTLGGATARPVAQAAPAPADSVATPALHSHGILIGTLSLIVVVCLVVWFISRRKPGGRYDSADAYSDRGTRGT